MCCCTCCSPNMCLAENRHAATFSSLILKKQKNKKQTGCHGTFLSFTLTDSAKGDLLKSTHSSPSWQGQNVPQSSPWNLVQWKRAISVFVWVKWSVCSCHVCIYFRSLQMQDALLLQKLAGVHGTRIASRRGLYSVAYILCCNPTLTLQIDDRSSAPRGFVRTFLSNSTKENAEYPSPSFLSLQPRSLLLITSPLMSTPHFLLCFTSSPVRPHPGILQPPISRCSETKRWHSSAGGSSGIMGTLTLTAVLSWCHDTLLGSCEKNEIQTCKSNLND